MKKDEFYNFDVRPFHSMMAQTIPNVWSGQAVLCLDGEKLRRVLNTVKGVIIYNIELSFSFFQTFELVEDADGLRTLNWGSSVN
jgi:hypothetical protein